MPRWILIAAGILALSGCCKERDATQYDLQRFAEHGHHEVAELSVEIDRFARSNFQVAQNLPLDAGRFLDWRKREWWTLRDELAVMMLYEWTSVEKLTRDVARYYGYSIEGFPRTKEASLRFFLHADVEWRNLVMDVCIFTEYQNREVVPLRGDLHRFYEHAKWETANLDVDVRSFLEWRAREYNKLVRNGRDWFAANLDDWNKLVFDIDVFRIHAAVEGDYLVANFSEFWATEHAAVPRLVDDVYRYTQWEEREYRRLREDAFRFSIEHTDVESAQLVADLRRYKETQVDSVLKLMIEVDRFFSVYEREVRPLNEDVKRWWRYNISRGRLAIVDLKNFYTHKDEEMAELEADMSRFISYGRKEWRDLVAHVKRFSTCAYDPAFGDGITPSAGYRAPPVMDDEVVRDWDINN